MLRTSSPKALRSLPGALRPGVAKRDDQVEHGGALARILRIREGIALALELVSRSGLRARQRGLDARAVEDLERARVELRAEIALSGARVRDGEEAVVRRNVAGLERGAETQWIAPPTLRPSFGFAERVSGSMVARSSAGSPVRASLVTPVQRRTYAWRRRRGSVKP